MSDIFREAKLRLVNEFIKYWKLNHTIIESDYQHFWGEVNIYFDYLKKVGLLKEEKQNTGVKNESKRSKKTREAAEV